MGGAGEKGSRLSAVHHLTESPQISPTSSAAPAAVPNVGSRSTPRRTRRSIRHLGVGLLAGLLVGAMPASGTQQHVVISGDTLSAIAVHYGVSLVALAERNGIDDIDHIVTGQLLVLPDGAAGGASTHEVGPGETLSAIAAQHGVAIGALIDANSLANPNLIVIGSSLTIPGSGPPEVARDAAASHVVAAGDTLAIIAARYEVTVEALAAANGIDDPDLIVIGATLDVDDGSAPEPVPSAPATPEPGPDADALPSHTVVAGDTLGAIAELHGLALQALIDANDLPDQHVLAIGTVLALPTEPTEPQPAEETAEAPAPAPGAVVGTDVAPRLEFWANEYGVPVDLFKALTWFESGWNNDVVSDLGAVGIGQLMPTTVEFVSTWLLGQPIDPAVPDQNIQASARFLGYLLDQTEDRPSHAVAAYYQGLTALRQHGIYDSSRFYVDGVLALRSSF